MRFATRPLASSALVATFVASLAACSADRIAAPGGAAPRAIVIDGIETDLVRGTYVCHNTFTVSNGNAQAVTVDWLLNTTTTGGTLTIPANGSATLDLPFQQSLVLFFGGMQIDDVPNSGATTCPGDDDGGNDGGETGGNPPAVELSYVCRNIFRIDNPNDAAVTFDWLLNTTSTGGVLTLAPRATMFFTAPFQQTFQLYYEGRKVTEAPNPGATNCPGEGIVDIRPGEAPNNVNLKANGLLSVALLGSEWFTATTVSAGDVMIGSVHVARKPNGTYHSAHDDVDGDGDVDLLVFFEIQELVRAGALTPSTSGLAVSWLWQGSAMTGSDAIRIVNR